jgi:xanthine/CO dehydrogenase XdhC/CoxF family maturation factor
LCAVLGTYGSVPRGPGALLVAIAAGQWLGSLSGGCVEEGSLAQLQAGASSELFSLIRSGAGDEPLATIRLPCGGVLENLSADFTVQRTCANYQVARGHPVLFGRQFWPQLQPLNGDAGAKTVLSAQPQACMAVAVDDPGVLWDVDTPIALQR